MTYNLMNDPNVWVIAGLVFVLGLLVVFGILRFRQANLFTWAIAWWLGAYVLFRFGFTAPIPASVISIYMGIVSIALLAFVSSSEERRDEVSSPSRRWRPPTSTSR